MEMKVEYMLNQGVIVANLFHLKELRRNSCSSQIIINYIRLINIW